MIYLKVVNSTATAQNLNIDMQGAVKVAASGTAITLKADHTEDTNTITEPDKIIPVTSIVKGIKKSFKQNFPPYSITVLQLQTK
jgi:alpha-N-arabinofuranosidase